MLKISTENNTYLYDNSTGYIIPFQDELERYLDEEQSTEELAYREEKKYPLIEKYRKINLFSEYFSYNENANWDATFLQNQIIGSYFENMQLVLTGNCNFRCEYCMYSDKYPDHVGFSNCSMTFDIAQKAVDLFAEIIKKKKLLDGSTSPSISFYGGEPLIEFELIKKIVTYAEEQIVDIKFGITTNGALLHNDMIEFLIEKNFVIAISLDGYKENHDRNRKLVNGQETFDIVWGKIRDIRKADQERKVNILLLCCIDQYTNLLTLADFFYENYELLSPCNIRLNAINQLDTTYYEFCENKYTGSSKYIKQDQSKSLCILRERLKKQYYGNISNQIILPFLSSEIGVLIGNRGTKRLPLNNSCIPGSKLTVLPNGAVAPCEKTGTDYIIGNVFDGIDFDYIQSLVNDFVKLMKTCEEKKCPIRRVCSACFAFLKDSKSLKEGFCDLEIRSKKEILKTICENLEHDASYYDKLLMDVAETIEK